MTTNERIDLRVLRVIERFQRELGRSPMPKEIAFELGRKSTGVVYRGFTRLIEAGQLKRFKNEMMITPAGRDVLAPKGER